MIGFQCPATVQPVFGRTPLFPASPQQPSSPSSGYQARQASLSPPNLLDYFPGLAGDGLRLNWAHAANSRSLLNQALMGDELMIEADVTLAETTRYPIPIMSHQPSHMSDITLEDWLIDVVRSETGKGVKLDFKSTRVVEPAFRVLARHAEFIKGPLVLNADILPGYKSSVSPVDPWTFLMLCRTRFPKSIISIGWTTESDDMSMKTGYTREMVDQMASLVKEYSLIQPVTFPINATMLKPSLGELQRLLFQVPNSSLTLWAHPGDPVSLEDLLIYRKNFSPNQIFYDLPEPLLSMIRSHVYRR
uniref:Menorin-like domain-containing protein n=1 Tax=Tetranychus urticae TaxID=32264 RepID=T1JVH8_TETUR